MGETVVRVVRWGLVGLCAWLLGCRTGALRETWQGYELPRVPQEVRVLDGAGNAVSGAEVTLVAGEFLPGFGGDDVVRGVTGGDGRVVLQRVPTRCYVGWAVREVGGVWYASSAVPCPAPASELRFAERGGEAVTQFEITGTEPWTEHGPLSVEFVVAGSERVLAAAPVPADGRVSIPPMPAMGVEAAVFCGDACVHSGLRELGEGLGLRPPQRVAIDAVDAQGAPVAGVEIVAMDGASDLFQPRSEVWLPRRRHFARTGSDGRAVGWISTRDAIEGSWWMPAHFLGLVPGMREALIDRPKGSPESGLQGTIVPDEPTAFPVHREVGGLPREVAVVCDWVRVEPGSWDVITTDGGMDCQVLRADERGVAWVPGWRGGGRGRQIFYVPWVARGSTVGAAGSSVQVPRPVVVPCAIGGQPTGLDLDRVVPMVLEVQGPTRRPAAGAWVVCIPEHEGEFVPLALALCGETDAAGRVVMPCLPGKCMVFAQSSAGAAFRNCTVDVASSSLSLELQPSARRKVQVVDEQGAPVVGFGFDAHCSGGVSQPLPIDMEEVLHDELRACAVVNEFAMAVTDRDGCAEVAVPAGYRDGVNVRARMGRRCSQWTPLERGGDGSTIVLRLEEGLRR